MRIFDHQVVWVMPTARSRPHTAIYDPRLRVYITACDKRYTAEAIKQAGGDTANDLAKLSADKPPCSICQRRHATLAS